MPYRKRLTVCAIPVRRVCLRPPGVELIYPIYPEISPLLGTRQTSVKKNSHTRAELAPSARINNLSFNQLHLLALGRWTAFSLGYRIALSIAAAP